MHEAMVGRSGGSGESGREWGRSERALGAVTLLLAIVCAAATAGALSARGSYEDDLSAAYELEVAGSRLLAAGLVEEAALGSRVAGAARRRIGAARDFDAAARVAVALAKNDRPSAGIVGRRLAAQRRARAAAASSDVLIGEGELSLATLDARQATRELTDRQRERRTEARDSASATTRLLLLAAAVLAALAVAAAAAFGRAGARQAGRAA